MLITGIEQRSARKYLVRIDNETSLVMDAKELALHHLKEGEEIGESAFSGLMEEQRRSCLQRCGRLLKDRDYPESRLREKLSESGYDRTVVDEAILSLKEAGYLDDLRFACDYVRCHIEDRSRFRIRQDLLKRGLSVSLIDKAFSELESEEMEDLEEKQIRDLLRKRKYPFSEASYEEKQKAMSFLHGKGYANELIRRIIEERDE